MWTKEEHPPSLVQRQVPRKQAFGCLRQPSEAHNLIGDISCLHIGLWSWWYLVVLYCKDPYIHNSLFFRKPPWILIDWVYLSDIQMFWNVCFIGPPYVWNVVVVSPQTHECPFQYDIWNHQHVLELFFLGAFVWTYHDLSLTGGAAADLLLPSLHTSWAGRNLFPSCGAKVGDSVATLFLRLLQGLMAVGSNHVDR